MIHYVKINKIYVCYQLFCTIVEPLDEPPFDEHSQCSRSSAAEVQNVFPSQFWLAFFIFYVEMTMSHGVFVIKYVSRGFEWLGPLRCKISTKVFQGFFSLVNYALPIVEYNR